MRSVRQHMLGSQAFLKIDRESGNMQSTVQITLLLSTTLRMRFFT